VINGVPKGPHSEEEAREELDRVVRESVKIPMEYYDDPYGRVNAASAFLERWDGARWTEVPETRRQIVLEVYLSEGHRPRRR
jgi:hypothetical protein